MAKTVVLAFFNDEATADDAVEALKKWDKADDLVKLDAIGVLALDDKGKIKTHKLGKRSVGKGAGIGLVLAVIAPPTLLAGVIGGGLLGAFHHKGLGLRAADRDRIASQLSAGQAAVGVLVEPGDRDRRLRQAHRARWDRRGPRGDRRGRRRGRDGRAGCRGGRDRGRRRPVDPRRGRAEVRRRAQGERRDHLRPAQSADRRGHRSEAERRERATDRRPHRCHVAAAGDARIPPGLVGVAPVHRLHQDGGRRS